ncbi:chlorophyll synthase ChlG [Ponticoccus sp. SC2-23]|uniref:chlorophyll synthase ChlG n=1 Tax=Alexandriicola marinus TaxID=2081710 RepID=UPI000FDC103C|nr:chlorophyll synthase ChlG [Alexandriicola marinus]MBM1221755.1 chlorophyll synthase ChlG [Ponticoccus sp. SC6-9]MBM1226106.1 chlorophyll synthase ChlG [Ponticoccus sp. SC6-15]MBM1230703.1 chlorophyll synthase ChlG [Ponticoccus sp. SC6-38]MBM1235457.1 chlorophyll synthase ChlG [Ponticoccus sp. SC6-45]MBM1239724.1 chlorophyll synthase ChlG [Ponticoccus sp. SC6-49]MBM1243868.1 chlorophyll synthase ChlG [Ponticoccus sp. SC2-64]MBM1248980.1 chlorophyll synthase ChlG [Ponticoccus sp. SC6-42]MB
MSVTSTSPALPDRRWPEPRAALRLIKPITWFPPMWAYLCGAVSVGASAEGQWGLILLGVILAGPIVCGMSQAANDWCDRHVDAINEPDRPIPSGRIPGRWGLWIALAMSVLSLIIGWQLGPWGFGATVLGVLAAWAYSAEPVRLKRSGIWGPGLVGLSYETLPWVTGAAVVAAGAPGLDVIMIAVLYGLGAHGLMTINDFKALEGDRQMGVNSLPVMLGPERAARVACVVMTVPQLGVIALLFAWGKPVHAGIVAALLLVQFWAMRVWLTDPKGKAPWFNGTGIGPYILGMLAAAFALRSIGAV